MLTRHIVLVAAVLVMALAAVGCQAPPKEEQAPKPVAVEVAPVVRGEVHTKTVLSGPIRAQTEVPVLSKLPLQVVAIDVKIGQQVEAGQSLVQLDNKDLKEQVRQAKAGLEVAQAALPPAEGESAAAASARLAHESAILDLNRIEYLKDQGVVSEQALEQARVRAAGAQAQYQGTLDQEKMARARYEQAQAALELARSQLNNATIMAPVAGIVTALPVEVGQMVSPGVPVATIVDMDQVKIGLSATEKDIIHLRAGEEVTVKVLSLDREFKGELTAVAPAADARTRSFPLEVTVPNDGHLIKPGMFAEVELKTEAVSDVLAIARSAIIQEGSRQAVYIVKDDKAYIKEIMLGLINDQTAQVIAGLNEGDVLVIKGQQYLRDSIPVSVAAGGDGR